MLSAQTIETGDYTCKLENQNPGRLLSQLFIQVQGEAHSSERTSENTQGQPGSAHSLTRLHSTSELLLHPNNGRTWVWRTVPSLSVSPHQNAEQLYSSLHIGAKVWIQEISKWDCYMKCPVPSILWQFRRFTCMCSEPCNFMKTLRFICLARAKEFLN